MGNINTPDIATVLACAVGSVPAHKLQGLRDKLERVVGRPLATVALNDPNVIRLRLRQRLRAEGATLGTVQSYEQLFMGIIRRAAVAGLVDAPPEGPWTTRWQSVLDVADVAPKTPQTKNTKGAVRSLAAWATAHGVDPIDVDLRRLNDWAESMAIQDTVMQTHAELALSLWREYGDHRPTSSDHMRKARLLRKAQGGSVKQGVKQGVTV